ncbi:hypothetical protein HJFPF1_07802 [Paramyrothecium foliicola]|nr:hypothetical protein HJFPF1_07802 [Paramyrothecium foliicola]
MPTESEMRSRRDSWPPTQVRLNPFRPAKDEPRPLLDDMDDDPFNYFLTPAPGVEEDLDVHLDFDAGIENPSERKEIVRSVSPSSLEGLSKPKGRPISPELDSDITTTDDEDEDEDYIRFNPLNFKLLTLSEFAIDGVRRRTKSNRPVARPNRLLQAASFPGPQPRGRGGLARGRPVQPRSLSASRGRPNHLWREPSPDVWSIEEETEEELAKSDAGDAEKDGKTVHTKTAKSFKKVRFVLPDEE